MRLKPDSRSPTRALEKEPCVGLFLLEETKLKKKTKTSSTQKNEFGWQNTPRIAEDNTVDAALAEADQADPSLQYGFANQKSAWNNHINNQFGADYSPETAAAMKYAGENEIDQRHGQAIAEDRFRRKQTKFGNSLAIRNARAPRMVQTGGTSSGTQVTNAADFWNSLISGGVQAGLSAI